jgi:hypothetical protein
MRIGKAVVCVLLIAALGGAWLNYLRSVNAAGAEYGGHIAKADESYALGLYIQAVEEYKSALAIKSDVELWRKIGAAYGEDYASRENGGILSQYIQDMRDAAAAFPKERDFWITVVNLQKDNNRVADAYKAAMQAIKALGSDDELAAIAEELRYTTELGYKVWAGVTVPQTGYATVSDGESYSVINGAREILREGYEYIGPLNKNGAGIYKTARGFRLIDSGGVERAVFPNDAELAGLFSDSDKLAPIKTSGGWRYFGLNGAAFEESFDAASSFADGVAVARAQGRWRVIDSRGGTVRDLSFEEVRLGADGGFIQNGVAAARANGKWGLYNAKFERIGDFAADDMDSCYGEALAFRSGGKWGFADGKGNIVIEPVYIEARSFSNGLAAVKDGNGLWGFINDEGRIAIPAQYEDVGYFTDNGACFVKTGDGWQELRLIIH